MVGMVNEKGEYHTRGLEKKKRLKGPRNRSPPKKGIQKKENGGFKKPKTKGKKSP